MPLPVEPGPGISEVLARQRSATLSDLHYDLHLCIPAERTQPITGRIIVAFSLASPQPIVLDFAGGDIEAEPGGDLQGERVPFTVRDGHLCIDAARTRAGVNAFHFRFTAGDQALNRQDEGLYTLFVPARAHLAFPCVDQPDLRARFRLTVEMPQEWDAVSNAAEVDRVVQDGRARLRFAETLPLPTYLFALAAGRFLVAHAEVAGRPFRILHQDLDLRRVERMRDAVTGWHERAIRWMEAHTGIPQPFPKLDIVLLPSFQFSGIEHPGALYYHASALLLDEAVPDSQRQARAHLIAHETAHLWFGDLVTMRWFDDVWMKEVFANLLADEIVGASQSAEERALAFLLEHVPPALDVDRTLGAHPVRQRLENLADAGGLYGPIVYHKAPIALRHLVETMGPAPLWSGVRHWLRTFAFGSAAWPELAACLQAQTDVDVAAWSRRWLESTGCPTLSPEVALCEGTSLPYGQTVLDETAWRAVLERVVVDERPLTRARGWFVLWDTMLAGVMPPASFVATVTEAACRETHAGLRDRLGTWLVRAYWRCLTAAERARVAPGVEGACRAALDTAAEGPEKTWWLRVLRDVALTHAGLAWLERVWARDEAVSGLVLGEADETALAMELAVRGGTAADARLEAQEARIHDVERRARLAFLRPALSPDPEVRARASARGHDPAWRRHEVWLLEAQRYLHHPVRATQARTLLQPSLALLPELQRTGDIFFPRRWADATLGGHGSPEAAALVRRFLDDTPDLPHRLRLIVLAAADDLFRASAWSERRT